MTKKNLDALLSVGTDGGAIEVRRKRDKHPNGWEPGIDTERGFIVTQPLAEAPTNWDAVLTELLPEGFDISQWQVDGDNVEVRAWDGNIGAGEIKRFYYFKARIRRRSLDNATDVDLEQLIASVRKTKVKTPPPVAEDRAYWVHLTDLQAGQADGDSYEGMVGRALAIATMVKDDIAMLRKAGKPVSHIFIPITGDLVEGTGDNWYAMQNFSIRLDRRDQVKLVRRLLTEILRDIAALGIPVHVAVVPGNHGENRNSGKAFTTLNDNDDVAIVEQIAEAFSMAEQLSHVTFSLPKRDRLSLTVEVLGHVVGLTHGHLARSTGSVSAKFLAWFKSMAASRDPIGDSDLLFCGHYHTYIAQNLVGDTYMLMGGALCDSPDTGWFAQSAGLVSDPCISKGTITRSQKIELLLPYFWKRTKAEAVEI